MPFRNTVLPDVPPQIVLDFRHKPVQFPDGALGQQVDSTIVQVFDISGDLEISSDFASLEPETYPLDVAREVDFPLNFWRFPHGPRSRSSQGPV